MKIEKIIYSGEKPNKCEDCEYMWCDKKDGWDGDWEECYWCFFIGKEVFPEDIPEWCPLITYDDCFDWMFFEKEATPHIAKLINNMFEKENDQKK